MSDPKREYYPPDIFSFSGESIEIDFKKDKQKSFAVYRAKIQKTEELEEDAAANCFSYKDDSYKDCTDSVVNKLYFQRI